MTTPTDIPTPRSLDEIIAEIDRQGICYPANTRKVLEMVGFASLTQQRDELKARLTAAETTLNCIALWEEGDEVTGSFDEPGSAQMARDYFLTRTELGKGEK